MSTLPKKVSFGNKPEPMARPRSNSITGLSSLSKCVVAHETHMEEMQKIIIELKSNIGEQDAIIKLQEKAVIDYKYALDEAVAQLSAVKDEIHKIWNS